MESIGSFEAKTHLSELLDRVAKGEAFQITKRGKVVALLIPAEGSEAPDLKRITKEIREIRKGNKLRGLKIRDLINAGRRF